MAIREIQINSDSFSPGENLSQSGGEFTHITVSYDISGRRERIDAHILKAIKESWHSQKINIVNTTLYWQCVLGNKTDNTDDLNKIVRKELKEKLLKIFVDPEYTTGETVKVFCMAGNIRAFAFEIDV